MTRGGTALAMALAALSFSAEAEWKYRYQIDPMGRGVTHYADTRTVEAFELASPYGKPQHATLQVRGMKGRSLDVLLLIERGQFNCRIDRCEVLVRFDDGKPVKYSAAPPSDHSSDAVFINSEPRFLAALKKSTRVRIEAELFRQGSRVFEFKTAGLNWPRTDPKLPANAQK